MITALDLAQMKRDRRNVSLTRQNLDRLIAEVERLHKFEQNATLWSSDPERIRKLEGALQKIRDPAFQCGMHCMQIAREALREKQ